MIYPCVTWIDGGGMTGLAWLWEGTHFEADEYPFLDAARAVETTCQRWGMKLAIGWERYDIRPRMPQTHAYDAIGINRTAEYLAVKYCCHQLKPAQQHTPDAREQRELKALGWWRPGKNDAQSAACHMLRYLRRSGDLPPRERAILSDLAHTI